MSRYSQSSLWLAILPYCLGVACGPCLASDVGEIVERATAALNADWAADPLYAYLEKDEVQKGDKLTSKTFEVVMIDGSEYHFPRSLDDQPLPPDRQQAELVKFKNEVKHRKNESPSARRARIEAWKKQRDENGELLLDFPSVLNFRLLGEEMKNGYPAWVLGATPKPGIVPATRAGKVLAGVQGKAWVEKDTLHPMHIECTVVTPVPVFGPLASVLPGTQIEIGMTRVTDSIWLIEEVSIRLNVAKLKMFKSSEMTRSTYSQFRPNSSALEELLSEAGQK